MNSKLPQTQSPKKAFTLIELLIVVAVLGVLTTIVVLRFTGVQNSARDAKRQSELKQYQTSLEVYANKTGGYPNTTADAVTLCGTFGLTGCPDDPKAPAKHYEYRGSPTSYVLYVELERKGAAGVTEFFVLCSNGKVGKVQTEPSSVTCPLP